LTKPSWKYVARKTFREFSDDQCTDLAAALTYYAVLALFPAVIALLSLVGLVGQGEQTIKTLLDILRDVGAGTIAETLQPRLEDLSKTETAGFGFVLGLAAALWSASGYVGAFGRGMNRVYEIDEGRPFWKLRPMMLLVTLVTVVLVAIVALGLIVSGPAAEAVGNALGLGSATVTAWNIAKWPVLLAVVVLIVALLYYATPNVKHQKFRFISVGAVVAIVVWVIASALFGFYVANFSSYDKTYGSLAGGHRLPALVVDHQPGAPLRSRARRRARARPGAAGGPAGGGDHPAAPAGHAQHRKGREEGARGHRTGSRAAPVTG
jgi:membrane protein